MSHRRKDKRAYVIAGASASALAAAAVLLPYANASQEQQPRPGPATAKAAAKLGAALAAENGARTAGWYLDGKGGKLVMNVTDEETAERVRADGATARVVPNSKAELTDVSDTLAGDASVPGTAWSVDPRTNKVVVLADRTVGSDEWASLTKTAEGMGGMVTMKRSSGEFKPLHGGDQSGGTGEEEGGAGEEEGGAGEEEGGAGEEQAGGAGAAAGNEVAGGGAIFAAGTRCSLGFNVTVDGAPAFLTAGHCGNAAEKWTSDEAGQEPLGTVADSKFPESDFALLNYDDPQAQPPSTVDLQDGTTQEITKAAEAAVGMEVQRSGSTTGLSDGTVTGLDATVNYGNGDIVNGLIQTDVCAEPGDSGGAMFAEDAAVGLTSGGSGDCTQGGETFFQPVTDALEATGAEIGAGGGDAGGGEEAGQ
ncbi:MAG: S1 family peptidase [Streptomyces sp.]|uniref:S1 family peptidase n=1 Tax=Streptomyces sp. TaxID=1931 RepID=UPI003D6A3FA2